jgi:hypothetical protein
MRRRKRTYKANHHVLPVIAAQVVVEETYAGSHHWRVWVYFGGYGWPCEPAQFGAADPDDHRTLNVTEGYGIFRPEIAFGIAVRLTGSKDFTEELI